MEENLIFLKKMANSVFVIFYYSGPRVFTTHSIRRPNYLHGRRLQSPTGVDLRPGPDLQVRGLHTTPGQVRSQVRGSRKNAVYYKWRLTFKVLRLALRKFQF